MVEVQVRVDDDIDAGRVAVGLPAQWNQARIHVIHCWVQLRHT